MRRIVTYGRLGKYGRLCNGAFGVASTIGVARKNGFDFAFPLWRNHDGLNFESNLDIDVYRHFLNPLPLYEGPELPERFVDWGYWDLTLIESVSLVGHMQSCRFFQHAIDEVRWYMRMIDEPPLQDVCSLHLRLRDYDQGTNKGYHPRMTLSYYEPAMAHFGSDQQFLVFSDDIPGAKELFRPLEGQHRIAYSEGLDYIQDFKRLKTCTSFIIANSSYSAMAAILGDAPDKQVIAPRPWFGLAAAPLTGEDIYDRGWLIVDYETGEVTQKS